MRTARGAILTMLILLLAALDVAIYVGQREAHRSAEQGPEWDTWRKLSEPARAEYTRRYQELLSQGRDQHALSRARRFARLTLDEQARLRALHGIVLDVLRRQPAVERRDLLRASPRARAFFVYQFLNDEMRQRLRQLEPTAETG